MAKYSQESIARLLTQVNIVDHISQSTKLQKKGSDFLGLCPFHQEKTPSFTVSDKKQFFYCFGCHKHGNVIDYAMEQQQLTFPEAVEYLAEIHHVHLEKTENDDPHVTERKTILDLNAKACAYYSDQLNQNQNAIAYLKNRGIEASTIKQFAIGYAPNQWQGLLNHTRVKDKKTLKNCGLFADKNGRFYDRMRDRIIFPIFDLKHKCIGFGGRVLSDADQPKYLNSPDTPAFHKSHVLFGLSECVKRRDIETLLVVEGYLDVIALHQNGIHCAVASLGTAFTGSHLKLLQRYAQKNIVFCFDGDKAGQRAMQNAVDLILTHIDDRHRFRFLMLPDQDDPDSIVMRHGRTHFTHLLDNATSLEEILKLRWQQGLDLNSIQDQAYFLKRAQSDLKVCKNTFFKKLLIEKLSKHYPIEAKVSQSTPEEKPKKLSKQPVSGWIECLACLIIEHTKIAYFIQELQPITHAMPVQLTATIKYLESYQNHQQKALLIEETRVNQEVHHWIIEAMRSDEPQKPVQFIESYVVYLKKRVLEKRIKQLLDLPTRTPDQQNALKNYIALKHAIKSHSTNTQ